jgi:hypothetical protein
MDVQINLNVWHIIPLQVLNVWYLKLSSSSGEGSLGYRLAEEVLRRHQTSSQSSSDTSSTRCRMSISGEPAVSISGEPAVSASEAAGHQGDLDKEEMTCSKSDAYEVGVEGEDDDEVFWTCELGDGSSSGGLVSWKTFTTQGIGCGRGQDMISWQRIIASGQVLATGYQTRASLLVSPATHTSSSYGSDSKGSYRADVRRSTCQAGPDAGTDEGVESVKQSSVTPPLRVLIIHGKQDMLVSVSNSQRLAALIPPSCDCELLILEQCGHIPQEEWPHQFAQLVSDLVKLKP